MRQNGIEIMVRISNNNHINGGMHLLIHALSFNYTIVYGRDAITYTCACPN